MGLLEDFLKNFREQTNGLERPQKAQPDDTTDRARKWPGEGEKRTMVEWGTRDDFRNLSFPDEEKLEEAIRGTVYAAPNRIHDGYRKDFMNNYQLFKSMVNEWNDEDNVVARHRLTEKYDKKYNFSGNPVFNEMMRQMAFYDDGEIKTAMGEKPYTGIGNPFTKENRSEWSNSFLDHTDGVAGYIKSGSGKWFNV